MTYGYASPYKDRIIQHVHTYENSLNYPAQPRPAQPHSITCAIPALEYAMPYLVLLIPSTPSPLPNRQVPSRFSHAGFLVRLPTFR